jgi:dipeptidyl aminopeptidase/acylaminoacyl peptidase
MSNVPDLPLIPRDILFGNPDKANPQVSPDGKRMAYLAPVNNILNVWVGTIGLDDYQALTNDTDRGVRFYIWAADNRHILYIQDIGGNENWRLYATDLETRETRDLTPFENVQASIIDHDHHFPNELLIGLNKDNPQLFDVYNLTLSTGELTLAMKNPGNVVEWVADRNHKVRAALAALPDGSLQLQVYESAKDQWISIITWGPDDNQTSGTIGFSADGLSLYLQDSRDVNAGRLVQLEMASGKLTVISEDPQYDVANVVVHPETYEIQAVAFNRDHIEWVVLDESIRADYAYLGNLQRGDFSVISRDIADDTWVVSFNLDNSPVFYYSYNRIAQNATLLFTNRPSLSKFTLAEMEPISFTARDGLTIHGYLTVPVNSHDKPIPLVLNVHGGPWARDNWGYIPETQWFANRGYACLQVNYRGSTGYGKNFMNAGNKEWGGKMHDDLVDAVQWAIARGIADPQKVAIYGGSYGGYAALVGATFTPDLFCCAVDIVGPSDLVTFLLTIPPYWAPMIAILHQRVGDPESELELLKGRSPLFKVDQIKIPMLIAQGANDPRVKQAESEQIVAAMQNKGIAYEYMLFPDEGHGFAKPENRLLFYKAAEKFLAKQLGGNYEE